MAAKADIVVDQGSDLEVTFLVKEGGVAKDLTNYTGAAKMRKHYTSTNAVSFTVTVDANTSYVTLSMYANTTANIVAGRYVYDVELTNTSNNHVFRVIEGVVTVTPEVTR